MNSQIPLPSLSPTFVAALETGNPIKLTATSSECTSLTVTPSGRLVLAGFTDGTLRVFPVEGALMINNKIKKKVNSVMRSSSSSLSMTAVQSSPLLAPPHASTAPPSRISTATAGRRCVPSIHAAAQIVSKGVHTNLLMHVDVSPDGLWAFAGVLRGSMELVALHLGHLEACLDIFDASRNKSNKKNDKVVDACYADNWLDWMNSLTVFKHMDAKLRGFGACTLLKPGNRYLLLTGKAIKNIHIWSFVPPTSASNMKEQQQPQWTQLYNTQTNGNTIKMLSFYINPASGALSALSKSDGQKLRVWDLSYEQLQQELINDRGDDIMPTDCVSRPSRPPFVDVVNTEEMLGLAGGYAVCGGANGSMYHRVSLVNLDDGDLHSPFNHIELALPFEVTARPESSVAKADVIDGESTLDKATPAAVTSPFRSRRPQRGYLISVERVAGMMSDAGCALLELSDGNLVQMTSTGRTDLPELSLLRNKKFLAGSIGHQLSVKRVSSCGLALAVSSIYYPTKGKSVLRIWAMENVLQRIAISNSTKKNNYSLLGYRGVPTLPFPVRNLSSTGVGNTILPTIVTDNITVSSSKTIHSCLDTSIVTPLVSAPTPDRTTNNPNSATTLEWSSKHSLTGISVASTPTSSNHRYGNKRYPRVSIGTGVNGDRIDKGVHLVQAKKRKNSPLDTSTNTLGRCSAKAQSSTKRQKEARVWTPSPLVPRNCLSSYPSKSLQNDLCDIHAFSAELKTSSATKALDFDLDLAMDIDGLKSDSKDEKKSIVVYPQKVHEPISVAPKRYNHPGKLEGRKNCSTMAPNTYPEVRHEIDFSLAKGRRAPKSPLRREKKRSNQIQKNDSTSQARIINECTRLTMKLQQLLKSSCPKSRGSPLIETCQSSKIKFPTFLMQLHVQQRLDLRFEHQSAKYRLIKSIVHGALRLLESILSSPSMENVLDARDFWTEAFHSYQLVVDERVNFQVLELGALMARQEQERQHLPYAKVDAANELTEMNQSINWELQSILDQVQDFLPEVSVI